MKKILFTLLLFFITLPMAAQIPVYLKEPTGEMEKLNYSYIEQAYNSRGKVKVTIFCDKPPHLLGFPAYPVLVEDKEGKKFYGALSRNIADNSIYGSKENPKWIDYEDIQGLIDFLQYAKTECSKYTEDGTSIQLSHITEGGRWLYLIKKDINRDGLKAKMRIEWYGTGRGEWKKCTLEAIEEEIKEWENLKKFLEEQMQK